MEEKKIKVQHHNYTSQEKNPESKIKYREFNCLVVNKSLDHLQHSHPVDLG